MSVIDWQLMIEIFLCDAKIKSDVKSSTGSAQVNWSINHYEIHIQAKKSQLSKRLYFQMELFQLKLDLFIYLVIDSLLKCLNVYVKADDAIETAGIHLCPLSVAVFR